MFEVDQSESSVYCNIDYSLFEFELKKNHYYQVKELIKIIFFYIFKNFTILVFSLMCVCPSRQEKKEGAKDKDRKPEATQRSETKNYIRWKKKIKIKKC